MAYNQQRRYICKSSRNIDIYVLEETQLLIIKLYLIYYNIMLLKLGMTSDDI